MIASVGRAAHHGDQRPVRNSHVRSQQCLFFGPRLSPSKECAFPNFGSHFPSALTTPTFLIGDALSHQPCPAVSHRAWSARNAQG